MNTLLMGTSKATYFSLVVISHACVVEYVGRPPNQTAQTAMAIATNLHESQLFAKNFQIAYCTEDEAIDNSYGHSSSCVRRIHFSWRRLRYNGTPNLVAPIAHRIFGRNQRNIGATDAERELNRSLPLHAWPRRALYVAAQYAICLQATQCLPSAHSRHAYRTLGSVLFDCADQYQAR